MSWSVLPAEILYGTFSLLDLLSFVRSTSVCKSWRLNASDDHYWKNHFHADYPLDGTTPSQNQTWQYIYIRKAKALKAIQTGNVHIRNIIAINEATIHNRFLGPRVSMYNDNVIVTCIEDTPRSERALGCHAKNIYTEETSKQIGSSEYFVVIGDHGLSFNVDANLNVQWNLLKVTKISSDISDIKISDEKPLPWHDHPFKSAVFNSDPTFTEMIGLDINIYQRDGVSVLYNWVTKEKIDLNGRITGTPMALYKNTLVTATNDTIFVYQNYEEIHTHRVGVRIQDVALNDNLLVVATQECLWIFDRCDNYSFFKLEQHGSSPIFLFEDLLVYRSTYGLAFYNVNERKLLSAVVYRGLWANYLIRVPHSPNEFLVQTTDTLMLLRFELKPSTISVLRINSFGKMKEKTIQSTNLLAFAKDTIKTFEGDIFSSFVLKKPGDKRYIMLFKGTPSIWRLKNAKANELLQEYFRTMTDDDYLYMPFCPNVAEDSIAEAVLHTTVSLKRDAVVLGDVIIYCEQFVNGKYELVKPDEWPSEFSIKKTKQKK